MVLDGNIILGLFCILVGLAHVLVNPHSNEVPPGPLKVVEIVWEALKHEKLVDECLQQAQPVVSALLSWFSWV
jgi:hypothetical protein